MIWLIPDSELTHAGEVDWVMNESPDPKLYKAGRRMAGETTRMLQNLVGGPRTTPGNSWPTRTTVDWISTALPNRGITRCRCRSQSTSVNPSLRSLEKIGLAPMTGTLQRWRASIGVCPWTPSYRENRRIRRGHRYWRP